MTIKTLYRVPIIKRFVFGVSLSFYSIIFGQGVPVEEVDPPIDSSVLSGAPKSEINFLGAMPDELLSIDEPDAPLDRLRLRDSDTNSILDMIQMITGRYILRPQNLTQVKINFDSFGVLTKRETLRALESLLAMNLIGITKIDDRFFKAVPAANMNVSVPIWLDGPATALVPSQRIYIKMYRLQYAPAIEVREQLTPFSTPNVGNLIVIEKANSILITDALLNLQTQRTEFPDEMVFIIYHQINELIFKMILWELDQVAKAPTLESLFFTEKLMRVSRYFDMLASSFNIMKEGMQVDQYNKFRL